MKIIRLPGRKAIFGYFLLTIFSTPVTLVIFYSPSVMHFRRIGSVIICPTAKYLVFLAKCMYLPLWSCGVERYLPLSAVLGGFCVALQKGVVSPRLYTLRSKTDSQPARLLISLCEILKRGDSIKIINKEVRISPYFWCGCRHCDKGRPFTDRKTCPVVLNICGKLHLVL